MAQIRNTAKVAKRGGTIFEKPPARPKEDWMTSSRLVYSALLADAQKNGERMDHEGVDGHLWKGNISAHINFIWPELTDKDQADERKAAQASIISTLTRKGSALCISRGGTKNPSIWFIASRWGTLPPPAKRKGKTSKETARLKDSAQQQLQDESAPSRAAEEIERAEELEHLAEAEAQGEVESPPLHRNRSADERRAESEQRFEEWRDAAPVAWPSKPPRPPLERVWNEAADKIQLPDEMPGDIEHKLQAVLIAGRRMNGAGSGYDAEEIQRLRDENLRLTLQIESMQQKLRQSQAILRAFTDTMIEP